MKENRKKQFPGLGVPLEPLKWAGATFQTSDKDVYAPPCWAATLGTDLCLERLTVLMKYEVETRFSFREPQSILGNRSLSDLQSKTYSLKDCGQRQDENEIS